MSPTVTEVMAAVIFAIAVLHTFAASSILQFSHRFPERSVWRNAFHLLGEVEVVFGFWAAVLCLFIALRESPKAAVNYIDKRDFTEPLFVFAIMTVAATKPILDVTARLLFLIARALPLSREPAIYWCALMIGPLLGSFITEPAAMTVIALLLKRRYYDRKISTRMMYTTLAVLFVNISIGGALTPFAAPPILMVSTKWQWTTPFMLATFGWKCALACALNATLATILNFKELKGLATSEAESARQEVMLRDAPLWLTLLHVAILTLIVMTAHHAAVFIGIMLIFMGIAEATREYQTELALRQSLLVAFFLGGLIVLGGLQAWWLKPLMARLSDTTLFFGVTGLTALTDNAALTYLGSFVENPGDSYKYYLVAGAIAGGGLTVIANAPNPAGFSILQERFGPGGIQPLSLFLTALIPTCIAMACLALF